MRPLRQCVNPQLIKICRKSMQMDSLNQIVRNYLPSNLQDHCRLCSYEKGLLTFVTNDAVFASELRFCLSDIRDKLRKEAGFFQLIATKIIIEAKGEYVKQTETEKTLSLSEASKFKLKEISERCNFPPLKSVLEKIIQG